MVTDILTTVDNLTDIIPGYDEDIGYELSGLIWFQGSNDMIKQERVDEYEYNLANLIRNVRNDLDTPDLPIIIGGMGQKGVNATGRGVDRYYAMQHAERSVTFYDEFHNTTLYVPTGRYMSTHLRTDPDETYNGPYHYDGRADVYYHIGRAFGHGILSLMGIDESSSSPYDDTNS